MAFPGGPFHRHLAESLPACRVAITHAASAIIREKREAKEKALLAGNDPPPCAEPASEPTIISNVLLADAVIGDHSCPFELLEDILIDSTHVDRYNMLLLKSLDILMDASSPAFTIEEAYGLSSTGGVGPLALVHQNRLQPEHAAVIGTIYGYPGEPLTGTSRPCPPGPGLQEPWNCLHSPWIFINTPTDYWGKEQARDYRIAAKEEASTPANPYAHAMVRALRTKIAQSFPERVATQPSSSSGRIRVVWPYTSDRIKFLGSDWRINPDNEATDAARIGPPRTLADLLAQNKELAASEMVHACSLVNTGIESIGGTDGWVIACFPKTTKFHKRGPFQRHGHAQHAADNHDR
jgi:hypothetical protein